MAEHIIKADNVQYSYKSGNENIDIAVDHITLHIKKGEFIAIVGRNGSGKSTFARMLNALLIPDQGTIYVNHINTTDKDSRWEIRRSVGMVFQNPDNQIVRTIVDEEIAFGLENLGIPSHEILTRVDEAMNILGISQYQNHPPHLLSGGQKQKVVIAGILAMEPECIVLDEATSMLDPHSRNEIMEILLKLNKEKGVTVIFITHNMSEASMADRIVMIDNGTVKVEGAPKEVLAKVEDCRKLGLDVPQVTELFHQLNMEGFELPEGVFDIDEAFEILCERFRLQA